MQITHTLIKTARRLRLAHAARRTEADLRRTYADAERYPERAAYYLGEVAPHLSLQLANLREQQRRLHRHGPMPVLRNMPALGHIHTPPQLRIV